MSDLRPKLEYLVELNGKTYHVMAGDKDLDTDGKQIHQIVRQLNHKFGLDIDFKRYLFQLFDKTRQPFAIKSSSDRIPDGAYIRVKPRHQTSLGPVSVAINVVLYETNNTHVFDVSLDSSVTVDQLLAKVVVRCYATSGQICGFLSHKFEIFDDKRNKFVEMKTSSDTISSLFGICKSFNVQITRKDSPTGGGHCPPNISLLSTKDVSADKPINWESVSQAMKTLGFDNYDLNLCQTEINEELIQYRQYLTHCRQHICNVWPLYSVLDFMDLRPFITEEDILISESNDGLWIETSITTDYDKRCLALVEEVNKSTIDLTTNWSLVSQRMLDLGRKHMSENVCMDLFRQLVNRYLLVKRHFPDFVVNYRRVNESYIHGLTQLDLKLLCNKETFKSITDCRQLLDKVSDVFNGSTNSM